MAGHLPATDTRRIALYAYMQIDKLIDNADIPATNIGDNVQKLGGGLK